MVQENNTLKAGVSQDALILTDNNIGHWFQVIQEDSLNLQSQITDNYIENNTAVQDHIALSPITYTLSGLIGEVVFEPPTKWLDIITGAVNNNKVATVSDKLAPIAALLPPVDNITQQAKNTVQYVESSFRRYQRIYQQFRNLKLKDIKQPTETVQKYTADKLTSLWQERKLVELISPYGHFKNMAIQSISLTQSDTSTVSNLSVTLKQINYAQTYTTEPDTDRMALYNAIQRTKEANHGKAQGVEVDRDSVMSQWFPNFAKTKFDKA